MRSNKRSVLAMAIAPLALAGCAPEQPPIIETVRAAPQALTSETTWLDMAPMASARRAHAALKLADGRVLVIGGMDVGAQAAESYDVTTKTWTPIEVPNSVDVANCRPGLAQLDNGTVLMVATNPNAGTSVWSWAPDLSMEKLVETAPLPDAAPCNATIVPLENNRALILTRSNDNVNPQFFSFLYDSAQVAPTPPIPAPKAGKWVNSAAIRLNENKGVLISGGSDNAESILYESNNTWSSPHEMTFPRSGHAAVLLPNGNVLITGGSVQVPQAGYWGDMAEIFDTKTMTWAPTTPMLNPRDGHTATALSNGLILVVGGSASSTAELFDPATQLWTALESTKDARYFNHAATLLENGQVLVTGGELAGTNEVAICDTLALAWEPLASLPKPANFPPPGHSGFHSATMLDNGQLLVVGGVTLDPDTRTFADLVQAAYVYEPKGGDPGTWTELAFPANAYALHTATKLQDGRVLVAGGLVGNTAEIFNPSDATWQSKASMPNAIMLATATLLQATKGKPERVLHVGGVYADGTMLTAHDVLLYDPALDAWTSGPDLVMEEEGQQQTSRFGHTATLLQDDDVNDDNPPKVLVVGGAELIGEFNGIGKVGALSRDAALFDPATDTWTAVPPMNIARAFHSATLLPDGRVLIAGGGIPFGLTIGGGVRWNAVYSSAEIYDPDTKEWTLAGNMNDPRAEHQAVLLESKRVLIAGGRRNSFDRTLASAEIFDPIELTWTTTSRMQVPRYAHSLTLLAGGPVAVGGFHPFSGVDSTTERFPQADEGDPCSIDDQCISKYCVDGVCCENACNSPCLACSMAKGTSADGKCEDVSGCSPYACDLETGTCGRTCSEINECASGHVCDPSGTCIRPLKNASIIDDASCAAASPAQSNAPPWPGLMLAAGAFVLRRRRLQNQRKL